MNDFFNEAEKQMNAHSKQSIAKKEEFDIPLAPLVSRNLRNEPDPFDIQEQAALAAAQPKALEAPEEKKAIEFKNNRPQVVHETPEEKAARIQAALDRAKNNFEKNSGVYSRNAAHGLSPVKTRRR